MGKFTVPMKEPFWFNPVRSLNEFKLKLLEGFLTSFGIKVLVQEEEEPECGHPGHVSNQNMCGPRLRKKKGRLSDPQEHGCHCQAEHSAELHQTELFISMKTTNLPGSQRQTPRPSGTS